MTRHYFAYGSNLNPADLAACLQRCFCEPDCVRPLGRALLADYQLRFDHWSSRWEGGALDIRHRPGSTVEGILFEVSPDGWSALDGKEGAPS